MIGDLDIHGLGLTDLIVLFGLFAITLREVADFRGWSRSSRTLRVENADLLRRNGELESTVGRHEETIRTQGEQIVRLEEQVRALEKLDQTAVLNALRDHEVGASRRADETHRLLGESTNQLVRIAEAIELQPKGDTP